MEDIAVLFNIRPWSESPNQDVTAWLHEYLVGECGSSLVAGASRARCTLAGTASSPSGSQRHLHRPGVGSSQRPSGGPGERAGGTVHMAARSVFFGTGVVECNEFLKVSTDGVPGAAACLIPNIQLQVELAADPTATRRPVPLGMHRLFRDAETHQRVTCLTTCHNQRLRLACPPALARKRARGAPSVCLRRGRRVVGHSIDHAGCTTIS